MIGIRFLGSGGDGVVVAAKILADTAVKSGYESQGFTIYGWERRGGKVESYLRISNSKILLHSKLYDPDYVILMGHRWADDSAAVHGIKDGGGILINSPNYTSDYFPSAKNCNIVTVDAMRISTEQGLLLPSGEPIINTVMLGAFLGAFEGASLAISLERLLETISEQKIPSAESNIRACQEAYRCVTSQRETGTLKSIPYQRVVNTRPYPVFQEKKQDRCYKCQVCYIFCPDLAITFKVNPFLLTIDYGLCKRCGICAQECPRNAIKMEGKKND